MILEEAQALALEGLWQKDMRYLSDQELQVEREYVARMMATADDVGDSMIPPELWREIHAGRIAWLDAELAKRQRIAGLYRRADLGFTREYVDDVKRRVDLAEYLVWKHPETKLKWYSGQTGMLGFCPWHHDVNHKSLGVWRMPEHHWFCFSCLEGGDIYSWLLKREARGFKEAVEIAARYAGVPPPEKARSGAGAY